ncbi:MAG: DMT family transporter [Bacteroidota bacterium]
MPTLFLMLATVFWGASSILIKLALQEVHPIVFVFFRFLVATLCLLPALFFVRKRLSVQDLRRGVLLGILLGGIMVLQTMGLKTVAASVSAFLLGFSVIFVLAIRFVVQRQLPGLRDMVTALICLAGLGFVTQSHGLLPWDCSVSYTLVSALCIALHTCTLSAYASSSNLWFLTWLQMATLSLLTALPVFTTGIALQLPTQATTWWSILFCAVFCSAGGFGIQAYAQQHLRAFKVSMILTLEPVFTTIFSWLLLGEVLQGSFYVGATMILGAIVLANWRLQGLEEVAQ